MNQGPRDRDAGECPGNALRNAAHRAIRIGMHHEQRRHGRPQRMRCLKRACGHERQCNRTGECEGIGEIVAFPAPQSDKLVHRIGIRNHALKRGLHNRRKRREQR